MRTLVPRVPPFFAFFSAALSSRFTTPLAPAAAPASPLPPLLAAFASVAAATAARPGELLVLAVVLGLVHTTQCCITELPAPAAALEQPAVTAGDTARAGGAAGVAAGGAGCFPPEWAVAAVVGAVGGGGEGAACSAAEPAGFFAFWFCCSPWTVAISTSEPSIIRTRLQNSFRSMSLCRSCCRSVATSGELQCRCSSRDRSSMLTDEPSIRADCWRALLPAALLQTGCRYQTSSNDLQRLYACLRRHCAQSGHADITSPSRPPSSCNRCTLRSVTHTQGLDEGSRASRVVRAINRSSSCSIR